MASVSLTASVRSNLVSLKSASTQLETTTERLSTGKKVSSAVDNPTNYFAAQNYNDRADALSSRLDGMSEATEQINAADNGITNIKAFLSQMKGVVNDALSNTDSEERSKLGEQFNELITQVRDMAQDSSYGGINLLYDNASSTVQFGESIGDSTLTLEGFNISAATGELDANGELGSSSVVGTSGDAYALSIDIGNADVVGIQSAGTNGVGSGGTSNTYLSALYDHLSGFTLTTSTTYSEVTGVLSDTDYMDDLRNYLGNLTGKTVMVDYKIDSGTEVTYDSTTYSISSPTDKLLDLYAAVATDAGYTDTDNATYFLIAGINTLSSVHDQLFVLSPFGATDVASFNDEVSQIGTRLGSGSGGGWSIDWGADTYQDDLADVIEQIEDVESTLKTQSSKLANNLAIITQREEFTTSSINILEEGADNLTLADMNEEGANLLALQTAQSLGVQSLSLASQQAANVLQLIQ